MPQIINAPAITLDDPSAAIILSWMAGQGTGTVTTITSPVASSAISVTVDNAVGIPVNAVISLGIEHLLVTAKVGKVLTVARGHNSTVAASYLSGTLVTELKYKTLNALGKSIVVNALKPIVANTTAIAGVAAANAAADAAANAGVT